MKILSVFAILFPILVLADEVDCMDSDSWTEAIHGKTADECSQSISDFMKGCEKASQSSPAVMVNRILSENLCLKSVLNQTLDQRLLTLKKNDTQSFKIEMETQKNFNQAAQEICQQLNACDGTMYRMTKAQCELSLTQLRLRQAKAILDKNLSFAEIKKRSAFKNTHVQNFVEGLCRLPKEFFLKTRVPENCTELAFQEFVAAAGARCKDE